MDTAIGEFDVIIAYGLLHCLSSHEEVVFVTQLLQDLTVLGGWNIVCAFNQRRQDLIAHPGFDPCLLEHNELVALYREWCVEEAFDEDIWEEHPHNQIRHVHSLTRLLAKKV